MLTCYKRTRARTRRRQSVRGSSSPYLRMGSDLTVVHLGIRSCGKTLNPGWASKPPWVI